MKNNLKRKFWSAPDGAFEEEELCDVNEQELAKEFFEKDVKTRQELKDQACKDVGKDIDVEAMSKREKNERGRFGVFFSVAPLICCSVCFLCAALMLFWFFSSYKSELFFEDEQTGEAERVPSQDNITPSDKEAGESIDEKEDKESADKQEAQLGIVGEKFLFEDGSGVRIVSFQSQSVPAAQMLRVGDVITEIDGVPTPDVEALMQKISLFSPDDKAEVLVIRGGHKVSFFVKFMKKDSKNN